MRMYVNAQEMYEEVKRDLAEMGIMVYPKSMQDKVIEGNPDYATRELQNYCYTLLDCKSSDIPNVVQPWADHEFIERVDSSGTINPGEAWKLRNDVWDEYLHEGKLAYTYNERLYLNRQLEKIIVRLSEDPGSRQLWLSIWNPETDPDFLGGVSRVPCSLGYSLQVREGKLNLHYIMRSCDFMTHFCNDVYLAMKLQEYIAARVGMETGNFTHTMFSLHVYQKDIEGVF